MNAAISAHTRLQILLIVAIGTVLGSLNACSSAAKSTPSANSDEAAPATNSRSVVRSNAANVFGEMDGTGNPPPAANRAPATNSGSQQPPANTGRTQPNPIANRPATNPNPTHPIAPISNEPLAEMPAKLSVRKNVEVSATLNFREERLRVREFGMTNTDEILLLVEPGHIFDFTNRAQFFKDPLAGVRHLVVEPSSGLVWCVFADQVAVVNPRTGGLSRYVQMPKPGYNFRVDESGRMYLFGPDVTGRGHAVILLNADGSFLKLLTIDQEIRDIAPAITSNKIFVATDTDIFMVSPPRAPEHIASLGEEFRGKGIVRLLADEPGGLYVATPDAVLWMSHTGTLSPIMLGVGGQLAFTTEGIAVFDPARQVLVKLANLEAALMKDRVRARAARELRDGLIEFARQNYFGAAVHLNRGIRFYPSATRVLYPLAVSRLQTGDYEGAAEAYADFKSAHADLARSLPNIGAEAARAMAGENTASKSAVAFNLGYAELRDANWQAAMREFERTVYADPENIAAYYNLAIAQMNLGLTSDAMMNLQEFLRLAGDGQSDEIANAKKLIELLGDKDAVTKMLERELATFEKAAAAAREAGENFAAATAAYNQFLAEFGTGVYAPYARDRIAYIDALRDQKAALDKIEAELAALREKADPNSYDVEYFNAVAEKYATFAHRFPNTVYLDYILSQLGKVKREARQALLQVAAQFYEDRRYRSAALIYARLLEWHPDAHALEYNLAMAYVGMKDWQRALTALEAYQPHARMQERPEIDNLVGAIRKRAAADRILLSQFEAAYRAGNIDAAVAALDQAVAADDQYAKPYYLLARMWQLKATPEYRRTHPNVDEKDVLIEALKFLTIALKLNPEVSWLRTRAQLFENMRDYEKAVEDYTVLITHRDNADDRRGRADAYRRLARDADAIADLRRIIELKPALREAIELEIRMIENDGR